MWKGCRNDSCGSALPTTGWWDGPRRCGRHRRWSSHGVRIDVMLTGSTGGFLVFCQAGCLGFSAKSAKRCLFRHWKFNEEPARISFSCERGRKPYVCCFRHISIDMVVCHIAAPEDSDKQMSLSTYDIKGLAGVMGIGTASLRIYTQLKILIVWSHSLPNKCQRHPAASLQHSVCFLTTFTTVGEIMMQSVGGGGAGWCSRAT